MPHTWLSGPRLPEAKVGRPPTWPPRLMHRGRGAICQQFSRHPLRSSLAGSTPNMGDERWQEAVEAATRDMIEQLRARRRRPDDSRRESSDRSGTRGSRIHFGVAEKHAHGERGHGTPTVQRPAPTLLVPSSGTPRSLQVDLATRAHHARAAAQNNILTARRRRPYFSSAPRSQGWIVGS